VRIAEHIAFQSMLCVTVAMKHIDVFLLTHGQ